MLDSRRSRSRASCLILVQRDGRRGDLGGGLHEWIRKRSLGLARAPRACTITGRARSVGGLHDGLDLLHVVDVEARRRSRRGGLVEQLAHRDSVMLSSPSLTGDSRRVAAGRNLGSEDPDRPSSHARIGSCRVSRWSSCARASSSSRPRARERPYSSAHSAHTAVKAVAFGASHMVWSYIARSSSPGSGRRLLLPVVGLGSSRRLQSLVRRLAIAFPSRDLSPPARGSYVGCDREPSPRVSRSLIRL